MFVFLPSLSNSLGKYMARQTRKKSGTGIYQVLRYALSFGAGVRQLSRLTGISFGVVQKLKNDHQNRPHDSLSGTSNDKWLNNSLITISTMSPSGIISSSREIIMSPPYGDDPRDQHWIKEGYKYK